MFYKTNILFSDSMKLKDDNARGLIYKISLFAMKYIDFKTVILGNSEKPAVHLDIQMTLISFS